MLASFTILLMLHLAGCSHIPVSTMLKMANFDGQDFVKLNPEEIRIKVLTSGPTGVRSKTAKMHGGIDTPQELLIYNFELQNYDSKTVSIDGGFFSDDSVGTEVYYRLTKEDVDQFYSIQSKLGSLTRTKFTYNVSSDLKIDKDFNGKFDDISLTLFLMLRKEDGFIKVLDGVNFK